MNMRTWFDLIKFPILLYSIVYNVLLHFILAIAIAALFFHPEPSSTKYVGGDNKFIIYIVYSYKKISVSIMG